MQMEKRKRGPNWLHSEKSLLIDLVKEHFGIVENKKTDAVSMHQKNAEWEKIATLYNSNTSHGSRSGENLKAAWENLKKVARKDLANSRMEVFKTGGGLPALKKEDPINRRVIEMIKPSAEGHRNNFDSDGRALEALEATKGKDDTSDGNIVSLLEITEEEQQQEPEEQYNNVQEELVNGDWTSCSSQLLKTPVAAALRRPVVLANNCIDEPLPLTSSGEKRTPWTSRRRPLSFSGTSLQKLNEKRLAAVELQMELALKEREEARKCHELDFKSKELEYNTKELEYNTKELEYNTKELDFKIKQQILQQEKMKTRRLQREMRKTMKESFPPHT